VKPAPFDYCAPVELDEVLALLARHGAQAKLLAGGQSLVAALNFRQLAPAVLVDLNTVRGLDYVRRGEDGGLRIGAMTRNSALETDPLIAAHLPLLHAAIPHLAHAAIRNRGTIGGSLAYADPAAELPAVTLALDARYRVLGPRGERWIPAEEFFLDAFRTALAPDEVLVEVAIPVPPPPAAWGFAELARRHGDRVLMGVAAQLRLAPDGAVSAARLGLQSAAPTPFLARGAMGWLAGRPLDDVTIAGAAARVGDEVAPTGGVHGSADYQRHLARVLTARVLAEARERRP
jgi:carbon-monoxide dehydrogenase medium subunit